MPDRALTMDSFALALADAAGLDRDQIGRGAIITTRWMHGRRECVSCYSRKGRIEIHLDSDVTDAGMVVVNSLTLSIGGETLATLKQTDAGMMAVLMAALPATTLQGAIGGPIGAVIGVMGFAGGGEMLDASGVADGTTAIRYRMQQAPVRSEPDYGALFRGTRKTRRRA